MSHPARRPKADNNALRKPDDAVRSPASFRDPAGFIFTRDGCLYRQVNESYRQHYQRLMESTLYDALVRRGWLVAHKETDAVACTDDACKVLCPQRLDFISYPYEWAFSQLRDAALLVLDVQLLALQHDMWLKDASAYNIQFHRGRPLLIDTLSFECYREGQPWVAYRQFCQHFLAPLALMARTDIRLGKLLRSYIDGIPLDLASRLLPTRTYWQPAMAMHIHLHAKTQRAYSSTRRTKNKPVVKVSRRGLTGLLQGLRKHISRLAWKPAGTEWAAYYQDTNYSETGHAHKQKLVSEYLALARPSQLWDLGANTGVFSRLASGQGIPTIAFDVDPAAVEINYRNATLEAETNLLPLSLDLTNPSPGLGWNGTERDSLLARGPVDCAMALALIHHLAIGNNVPLARIAAFLSQLCRWLIIEFVPKSDGQVKRLLSSREDVFSAYSKVDFEDAFGHEFAILHCDKVKDTQRTLYLMRRK